MSRQRHAGDFAGERAREMGRRGAAAAHAKRRAARELHPYAGDFQQFLTDAGFTGESWRAWRTLWKCVDAQPLDENELALFQECTGRTKPPTAPVRELWLICGRRSGKTRLMAARGVWTAIRRLWPSVVAIGERVLVPCVAADKDQAHQMLDYVKGFLVKVPAFAPYLKRKLRDAVELTTGITIKVAAGQFTTARGFTAPLSLNDEIAFWPNTEQSASPDTEILAALKPSMATMPDRLLVGSSTPYAQRGALFKAFERYWGQDDANALVWRAASLTMNPVLDRDVVAEAYEDDPVAAASDFDVQWRSDVQNLFSPEAVRAVTVQDRHELPPQRGTEYLAFVDPSGGSVDSFVLAISHRDGDAAVLDLVREIRAPLSPDAACDEISGVLPLYGISEVVGDRYAAGFTSDRFRAHSITYTPSELSKSDLYRELLPLVNSARCELLDLPRLRAQLVGLERRVSRGGKDSIDHPPGGHDDIANAAAGALVLASKASGSNLIYAGGRVMNLLTGEGFGDPWENA